jgi:hypothetical protein
MISPYTDHDDQPHHHSWPWRNAAAPWFVERMDDDWCFGIMMTSGAIFAVSTIVGVSEQNDGTLWIDVKLMPDCMGTAEHNIKLGKKIISNGFYAPTDRLDASINAAHIMAVFELSDT